MLKTIDAREEGDREIGDGIGVDDKQLQFQLSGATGREKIADLELAVARRSAGLPTVHFYLRPLQDIQLFINHNTTARSRRRIWICELGVAAAWKSRRRTRG